MRNRFSIILVGVPKVRDKMSKEETLLKQQLAVILKNTFDNYQEYDNFKLKIFAKELKSKHGEYFQNDRRIEIFNLSRSPGANMLTAIHELAHHVEAMDIGETAHKQTFYDRFYQMICTALKLGYIDEEDIQEDRKDSKDFENVEKFFGLQFLKDYKDDKICNAVIVKKAYAFRKLLHRRDFSFLGESQSWGRIFETEEQAKNEMNILLSLDQSMEIELVPPTHLMFNQNYYISVEGAYEFKDKLRKSNFIWEGYGFKKRWVKKVPSSEYKETMDYLKTLRLVGKKVVPISTK